MNNRPLKLLYLLVAALFLCFAGFNNRFPFVYPDTGAYIGSGWAKFVPNDRPIFYGLFMRHSSLGDSLFLVIFVQGLLVSLLIYFWFQYFNNSKWKLPLFLTFIFLITFFTGASLNVSQLIPDIFAATMIMSITLLLFAAELSMRDMVIISGLCILSMVVHNSHIYIGIICFLAYCGLLIFKNLRPCFLAYEIRWKRMALVSGLFAFSIFLIPAVHAAYGGGWTLSNGKNVFMMGRLVQLGIVTEHLQEACPEKGYKLCDYVENPLHGFLWDYENSPLYKTGGWEANKKEYGKIIRDIFSKPRFLTLFILRSLEATFQQFFHFDLGDTTIWQPKESSAYWHVEEFLPDQIRNYKSSLQHQQQLDFTLTNVHQRYLLGFALLLSILLLTTSFISGRQKLLIGFILICLLANAAICGSLSGVLFRYQCRVMWLLLLPLFVILGNREVARKLVSHIKTNIPN